MVEVCPLQIVLVEIERNVNNYGALWCEVLAVREHSSLVGNTFLTLFD